MWKIWESVQGPFSAINAQLSYIAPFILWTTNTSDGSKQSLLKLMRSEYDALRWLDSQHINHQWRTAIGLSLIRLLHWAFQSTEEQVATQETRRTGEKMADRFSRFNEERDFQVKKTLQELHVSKPCRDTVYFGESWSVQFGVTCLSRWARFATVTLEQGYRPSLALTSSRPVSVRVAFQLFIWFFFFFRICKKCPNGLWRLRRVVIWPLVVDSGMLLIWDAGRMTAGWTWPGTERKTPQSGEYVQISHWVTATWL